MDEDPDGAECTLVAGDFAKWVQAFLAFTAVVTLIYKRHRERPRRQWKVWFMDFTKQGFASSLQHGVNVVLGIFLGQGRAGAGECIWYFVNFTITCFCGLVVLYYMMQLYDWVVHRYKLKLLVSGDYGTPPMWKPWALQLVLWCLIACLEKVITTAVVILPLYNLLDQLGVWLEQPLLKRPKVELVLVMVVSPAILNSFYLWVCDNIIKGGEQKPTLVYVPLPISALQLDYRGSHSGVQITQLQPGMPRSSRERSGLETFI